MYEDATWPSEMGEWVRGKHYLQFSEEKSISASTLLSLCAKGGIHLVLTILRGRPLSATTHYTSGLQLIATHSVTS